MAQRLLISNERTEADQLHIVFAEQLPTYGVTDDSLSGLDTTKSTYFTENHLVLKIVDEDDLLAHFGNPLEVNPAITAIAPSENVSSFSFPFEGLQLTMVTWWSMEVDNKRLKSFNYESLEFTLEVVSVSADQVICKIPDDQLAYSKDFFRSLSIAKPKVGFSQLKIKSKGFLYKTFWFRTTDEPIVFSSNDISEDLITPSITENIYLTPPHTFETLFIPTLSASFEYNFYEIDENSFRKASNRNYLGKDVREIPKYVKLSWNKAPVIYEIKAKPLSATPGVVIKSDRPTTFSDSQSGAIKKTGQIIKIGGYFFTPETSDSIAGTIMGGDTDTSREISSTFGDGGGFGGTSAPAPGSIQSIIQAGGTSFDTVVDDLSGVAGRARPGAIDSALTAGGPSQTAREMREAVIASLGETTRYVAYIIFKEMYDEVNDEFVPVDVIAVRNMNTTTLIDWKVAYGTVYRYKIRTICKFIVPKEFPIYQDTDATFSEKTSDALFRDGVILGSGFYYDSEFSPQVDVDTIENRRPDAPSNVKIFPNSKKKNMLLTWCQKNQNKDVSGFNVFRKENVPNSFFSQINRDLLGIRINFFVDNLIEPEKEYIYAIQAVDIHDNKSVLSAQYTASLKNQNIEHDRSENSVVFFADEGLEIDEIVALKQKDIIEFDKRFEVIINPLFVNLDTETTFLIKITSLDTFMKKEVKLNFITKIVNHVSKKTVAISTDTKSILDQKQKVALELKDSVGTQIGRKIIR